MQEEQQHLDRIHDRVDELRRRADARLAATMADRPGSTFQAVFERDVTAHHHAARSARYTFGDVESLAFGRLDLDDGDQLHVGRVSVVDRAGDVVLVDWRAPAAAAFYQATAAHPQGVARRRTLTTKGRVLRDLDDELIDHEAADRLGLEAVTGQGALLASLARSRSTTMRDIVATIQADQDRIVRTAAAGTLIVTGGPGTGKTVVALHRVAYLLYQDRDRFEGRGVLVVGPSRAFTEYTARVLPALGEDRAVQRPLEALAPSGVTIHGWDTASVAAIKGDLAMVDICERLLHRVVPPLPPSTRVSFEGTTVQVRAAELEKLRTRLLDRVSADQPGTSYHGRAAGADESLRTALWRAWRSAHRAAGEQPPEERLGSGFDGALDDAAEVTMLRRCFWPDLQPDDVLGALADGRVEIDDVAAGVLDPAARESLMAAWRNASAWTIDDVGLLDEVAALLGEHPPPPTRDRDSDPGMRVTGDVGDDVPERVDIEAPGYRDFAHVVVDEAQDLTPMQWRAVARRGPYASWTVVGDLAQRSRVSEPSTWEAIAALIGRRRVVVEKLTINYRTPAEIVAVARAVLAAAGHDPDETPTGVRAGGDAPEIVTTDDPAATVASLVRGTLSEQDGTVAVIAPTSELDGVARILAPGSAVLSSSGDDLSSSGDDVDDVLDPDRVRVLHPRTAKGLEFDDVIIVAPESIVAEDEVGTHQLYVAVTRATRRVRFVTSADSDFPGRSLCAVRPA